MYKKVRSLLALIHQCLLYTAVLLTLSAFFANRAIQIRTLFLLIPVVIVWALLPKLSAVWQLLLVHGILLFLPPIWCRSSGELTLSLLFIVLLFFVNFLESRAYDRRRTFSDPSVTSLILYPVLALINEEAHNGSLIPFFLIVMCLELLIYILDKFLSNMSDFVGLHQSNAEMPLRQMERVDHGMILVFLLLIVAVIILFRITHIDRILAIIPDTALWLLRIIFSIFSFGKSQKESSQEITRPLSNIGTQDFGSPSRFLLVLGKIIGVIIIAGLIILAVIALYRLLSSHFNRRADNKDHREFLMPFQKEERLRYKAQKDALSWRDFSPSGQVRRTYIKTILKAKKKKQTLSSSHTPSELEQSVQLTGQPQTDALHTLYEKARYSQDGCDQAEWENYKRSGM